MNRRIVGGVALLALGGAMLWAFAPRPGTGTAPAATAIDPVRSSPAPAAVAPPPLAAAHPPAAPAAPVSAPDCRDTPPDTASDEAVIAALRAGALRADACRALMTPTLAARVVRLGCETADFPVAEGLAAACASQWVRAWDATSPPSVDPLGNLDRDTLVCVMRALATVPPELARTVGTWLALHFGGIPSGPSDATLDAVAATLLQAHPAADSAWWSECWSGVAHTAPRQFAVRMALLSAISRAAPDLIGPFLREAIRWDAREVSEPDRLEGLSFYGLATRSGAGAQTFALDFIQSRDPVLQIIAFSALPYVAKWPMTRTPAGLSPDVAESIEAVRNATGQGVLVDQAWRTAWWRNDWTLTGPQVAAANFHRDLSVGLDRDPDALLRVSYAFMILPMLEAQPSLSTEAALVRRGLQEGFRATSDAHLSSVIFELAQVLNADPDEWKAHQKLLLTLVGDRRERLSADAKRALSTN